jgi:SAM-dependent methyltransferase
MSRDDYYASPFGVAFSAYMERPRLSRLIARLVWGADVTPYYESMAAVGEAPAGGIVVDCPCGAGPALMALSPRQQVRYLAFDLSPSMLRRAKGKIRDRALPQVELAGADATALPLPDGCADLFLSYWGLHCFPDPEAAIMEIGRVLRPGGRLVGASFVRGPSLRQRVVLRPGAGDFGPMCTEAELVEWLGGAGLRLTESGRSGLYMFFSAELGDQQAQAEV